MRRILRKLNPFRPWDPSDIKGCICRLSADDFLHLKDGDAITMKGTGGKKMIYRDWRNRRNLNQP